MAVTTTNVFSQYTSTGATNTFAIGFYLQSDTWLRVLVDNVSVAFTAVINIDQDATPGGSFTVSGGLLGSGHTVRVERHTPLTQLDVFQPYIPFPAQTVEFAFDQGICITQELAYALSLITIPPLSGPDKWLHTDGATMDWRALPQVLPTPYITGYFLAATSPSTLAWVAGGGGGGGAGIVGPFVVTPTNADGLLIDGIAGDVIHLVAADATNPGGLSIAKQQIAGQKMFVNGAVVELYDIRQFDSTLVPNDPTKDMALAYYRAYHQILTNGVINAPDYLAGAVHTGALWIPEGSWYTSMPLMITYGMTVYGDGINRTYINVGTGTPLTPSLVQGFSGPVFYANFAELPANIANLQSTITFGPSLNGGASRSLQLVDPMQYVPFHNCYAFSWWLGMMIESTQFGLKFEYKIPTLPSLAGSYHIFGPEGPPGVLGEVAPERPLTFRATYDGTHIQIHAYITTDPGWLPGSLNMVSGTQVELVSGNVPINSVFQVELDYTGTNLYLYIDGTLASSISITGPMYRNPWTAHQTGQVGGYEGDQTVEPRGVVIDGSLLGCIKFSNIPYHTGSNFTRDLGPYTADINTLWLCNWDQTDFPLDPAGNYHLPFVLAKAVRQSNSSNNGPDTSGTDGRYLIPHYLERTPGIYNSWCRLSNLNIFCGTMASGLRLSASPFFIADRVVSSFGCHYGFSSSDGVSFFSNNYKCYASAPADYGFLWYGNSIEPYSLGAPIGVQVLFGGEITNHYAQPNFTSFIQTILGPGNGTQSLFIMDQCSNDAEGWAYVRQITPLGLLPGGGSVFMRGNILAAGASSGPPAAFLSSSPGTGALESFGDSWQPATPGTGGIGGQGVWHGSPCQFIFNYAGGLGAFGRGQAVIRNPVGFIGPTLDPSTFLGQLPYSNVPGTVVVDWGAAQTRLQSVTVNDVVGFNVEGEFEIPFGSTSGKVTFTVPEPDNNYDIWVGADSYVGSAPAAGSKGPGLVYRQPNGNGFFYVTGVDPGGSCIITFKWHMIRRASPVEVFFRNVTIPSTAVNPLIALGKTNFTPWAIGFNLSPASGHVFVYNSTNPAQETMFSTGVTVVPADGHSLEFHFDSVAPTSFSGRVFGAIFGTFPLSLAPTQTVVFSNPRNVLINLFSPGSHNICLRCVSPEFLELYVDGGFCSVFALPNIVGAFPFSGWSGLLHFGELIDGTHPMTRASMHDFKMDADYTKCITLAADNGPIFGQQEALMLGDDWVLGIGAGAAGIGGFCSQVQQNKYPTYYYWMGAFNNFWVYGPPPVPNTWDLYNWIWYGWGQYKTFNTAVVLAGWHDLLNDVGTPPTTGNSGATVFANLQRILEGNHASQSFTLPTDNTHAIALFYTLTPTWGGGASWTIAGVTFPLTFTVDQHTSFVNVCAVINADATVGPLGQAVPTPQGTGWIVTFTATAPGSSGNGIPVAGAGAGAVYTGFPAANATFAGQDTTLNVNGVSFVANFITSQHISCNTLVSEIAASVDPRISGIVTAANVADKCIVTAVTAGLAGNTIPFGGVWLFGSYGGGYINDPLGFLLQGGANGLLNRVPNIFLCTVAPFGVANAYYTAGKETQRQAYNTAIRNWVTAHAGAGAVLFDLDATVKDGPGTSLNGAYNNGSGHLNDAGAAAAYAVLQPLLP